MSDKQVHPLNVRDRAPHRAEVGDFDPRGIEVPSKPSLEGPPERVRNEHRKDFPVVCIDSPSGSNASAENEPPPRRV
jgi:hypothetical protein